MVRAGVAADVVHMQCPRPAAAAHRGLVVDHAALVHALDDQHVLDGDAAQLLSDVLDHGLLVAVDARQRVVELDGHLQPVGQQHQAGGVTGMANRERLCVRGSEAACCWPAASYKGKLLNALSRRRAGRKLTPSCVAAGQSLASRRCPATHRHALDLGGGIAACECAGQQRGAGSSVRGMHAVHGSRRRRHGCAASALRRCACARGIA